MLGESEHTHITGRVAQILTGANERTYSPVATVFFSSLILFSLFFPLFFLILYLYICCFQAPPSLCIMLGVYFGVSKTLSWLIIDRFVCTIASILDMTRPALLELTPSIAKTIWRGVCERLWTGCTARGAILWVLTFWLCFSTPNL